MCVEKDIYDIWRKRNPELSVYSWKRLIGDILKMSRIDYFLVPRSFSTYVKYIFYKHTVLSDHNFVCMNINFRETERGPGVWVFNNVFLQEEEYINKITNLVTREVQEPIFNTEVLIWWDNLKYKIKKLSQLYGNHRNRKRKEKYNKIQHQLNKFTELLANGKTFDFEKYEILKQDLASIEYEKCQAAILRSKAFWAVEEDTNSRYFLNLEKYKQNMNCVSEIIRDDGVIVNDTDSILDEEYKFYQELYNCVEINENNNEQFYISHHIRCK